MHLVLTDERVLIFAADGRSWRLGSFVGEIPRTDLKSVTLPFIGGGQWKVIRFERTSGAAIQFMVDRDNGQSLANAFDPGTG